MLWGWLRTKVDKMSLGVVLPNAMRGQLYQTLFKIFSLLFNQSPTGSLSLQISNSTFISPYSTRFLLIFFMDISLAVNWQKDCTGKCIDIRLCCTVLFMLYVWLQLLEEMRAAGVNGMSLVIHRTDNRMSYLLTMKKWTYLYKNNYICKWIYRTFYLMSLKALLD